MPFFVVAFPRFAAADHARIDALRARFDPQHTRVAAHVTLVFGVRSASVDPLIDHVASVASRAARFAITLGPTRVVRDVVGGGHHVFLLVGEGAGEIAALHHALYAGPLAGARRDDVPFVPHVTVAGAASEVDAERAKRAIDAELRPIAAAIEHVDLLDVDGGVATSVRRFALR